MRAFAQKQKPVSSKVARSHTAASGLHHRADPIRHLQRTIGNRAVQRLLMMSQSSVVENIARRIAENVHPEGVAIISEVLRSFGQPLDHASRTFMEWRFGHDFSQHTDAQPAKSAKAVNPLVYTPGHDIVFSAGQYLSGTSGGRRLLTRGVGEVISRTLRRQAAATSRSGASLLGDQLRLDPQVAAAVRAELWRALEPQPLLDDIVRKLEAMPPEEASAGHFGDVPLSPTPRAGPPPSRDEPPVTLPTEPLLPATGSAGASGPALAMLTTIPAVKTALDKLRVDAVVRWNQMSNGERVGTIVHAIVTVGAGGGILLGTGKRYRDVHLSMPLDKPLKLFAKAQWVQAMPSVTIELDTRVNREFFGVSIDLGSILPPLWGFGSSAPVGVTPARRIAERSALERGNTPPAVPPALVEAATAGNPLEPFVRSRLETALGADLAHVRVHTDTEADRLTRAVQAIGVTVSNHIFFRAGAYRPATSKGLELIAHEVVHTLQAAAESHIPGASTGELRVSEPHDPQEQEADQIARLVTYTPADSRRPTAQIRGGIASRTPAGDVGGAVSPGVECATEPLDRIVDLYKLLIEAGRRRHPPYSEAAANLENFLSKAEAVRYLNADFILQDVLARSARSRLQVLAFDEAFTQANRSCYESSKSRAPVRLKFSSSIDVNPVFTPAVLYAIGRFNLQLNAMITLTARHNASGTCTGFGVLIEDAFAIDDEYNWHPGMAVEFPYIGHVDDRCAQRLVEAGRAKTFQLRVRWLEKQAFELECTPSGMSYDSEANDRTAFPPPPSLSQP